MEKKSSDLFSRSGKKSHVMADNREKIRKSALEIPDLYISWSAGTDTAFLPGGGEWGRTTPLNPSLLASNNVLYKFKPKF